MKFFNAILPCSLILRMGLPELANDIPKEFHEPIRTAFERVNQDIYQAAVTSFPVSVVGGNYFGYRKADENFTGKMRFQVNTAISGPAEEFITAVAHEYGHALVEQNLMVPTPDGTEIPLSFLEVFSEVKAHEESPEIYSKFEIRYRRALQPYNELFADLVATLAQRDLEALPKAIKVYQQSHSGSASAQRSFKTDLKIFDWNLNALNPEHTLFDPARAAIGHPLKTIFFVAKLDEKLGAKLATELLNTVLNASVRHIQMRFERGEKFENSIAVLSTDEARQLNVELTQLIQNRLPEGL